MTTNSTTAAPGSGSACPQSEQLEEQLRRANLGLLVCAALALGALILFLLICLVGFCRRYVTRRDSDRCLYSVELQELSGTRLRHESVGATPEIGIYQATPQGRSPVGSACWDGVGGTLPSPRPAPPPRPQGSRVGSHVGGAPQCDDDPGGYGYGHSPDGHPEHVYASPFASENLYANT